MCFWAGGGRRLTQESHDGLVKSLNEIADEGVFELHIVSMEKVTFSQKVEAVAESSVSLCWIPLPPRLHEFQDNSLSTREWSYSQSQSILFISSTSCVDMQHQL